MDPIQKIKRHKDSSFAMLLEGQRRGWPLWYMEMDDLYLRGGVSHARMRPLKVFDDPDHWFELGEVRDVPLHELDVVLMRKDPPFDMEYIYATYLLEQAETRGTLVVNRPSALRNANEKLYTAWFGDFTPPTLVSRFATDFKSFLAEQGDVILKPLGGMGGSSIFRVRAEDPNTNVIIETLTRNGTEYAMAQRFIPEIKNGDKRILVINGEPVPYVLARIPAKGETRGNLAVGGTGRGQPISDRDREIVTAVGPSLREAGILFAGLDVIGDWLTEINVTSPTCIRELDSQFGLNIAGTLFDAIEDQLALP